LGVLLILTFLVGGGSRSDIASLILLRPIAIGLFCLGLYWLKPEHVARHRFLLVWAGAVVVLVLFQLIPLPPALWQALPGRDLVMAVDQSIGADALWRPLTMSPMATRNALWSLSVPLACLVLAVQLDREALAKMVPLILLVGSLDFALSSMQILGDPDGSLYFYHITNNGAAVGLFANRNHHALYLACILPLLAFWARTPRRGASSIEIRRPFWIALAGAALILPLILITGSRAGLALALVALAFCPLVVAPLGQRLSKQTNHPRPLLWGVAGVGAILLAALLLMSERGTALDRLFGSSAATDDRIRILPTLTHMLHVYMPWGTGFGSFEKLFMVHEPAELLAPTYMNHAHNDWIELLLTGGIPGLLLALALAVWVFRTLASHAFSTHISTKARALGRLGGTIMILAALASATDYPMRVPSLACLAMLALVWIGQVRDDDDPSCTARD
jgi:hypothetical protein